MGDVEKCRLEVPMNRIEKSDVRERSLGSAACRSLGGRTKKSCHITSHPSATKRKHKASSMLPKQRRRKLIHKTRESRTQDHSLLSLYLRDINALPLLTNEAELALGTRIQRGDREARKQLICANLRLVIRIAREYEGYGLPLLDLINEGNLGLIRAASKFDPTRGAKFSTYSSWWIKQSMRRSLSNQSKTIRLPVHIFEKLTGMRRVSEKLRNDLGQEPTIKELASALGKSEQQVAFLRQLGSQIVSLDETFSTEDNLRLEEKVADDRAENPYQSLILRASLKLLSQSLAKLSTRDLEILRCRYGLDGHKKETLEELGERLGITRERVRQLQNLALKQLRKMVGKRENFDFAAFHSRYF